MSTIQDQAVEKSVASPTVPCTSDSFGNATDRAAADTKVARWQALRDSQYDFSIAFARCAVRAPSRANFLNFAGAMGASLTVAVFADYQLTNSPSDFQRVNASKVRTVATWILGQPGVSSAEQKDLRTYLNVLDKINPNDTVTKIGAAASYPIPFETEPDWQGFTTRTIVPTAIVLTTPVLKHKLAILQFISKKPLSSQDAAARDAYDNLFINVKHLPSGPLYVVMMIYGPPANSGAAPEYAYIFTRDSANRWQPRIVSEKELDAIESAMGRRPNF